jgi:hypothetical protein
MRFQHAPKNVLRRFSSVPHSCLLALGVAHCVLSYVTAIWNIHDDPAHPRCRHEQVLREFSAVQLVQMQMVALHVHRYDPARGDVQRLPTLVAPPVLPIVEGACALPHNTYAVTFLVKVA